MNKNQKKVVLSAAAIVGFMLVFPPYLINGFGVNSQAVMETGYAFIFELPARARLDVLTLFTQWAGVCLLAGAAYKFFENFTAKSLES